MESRPGGSGHPIVRDCILFALDMRPDAANSPHIYGAGLSFTTNSVLIWHHIRQEVLVLWTVGHDGHEAGACGSDISQGLSKNPTRQSRRRRDSGKRYPVPRYPAREITGCESPEKGQDGWPTSSDVGNGGQYQSHQNDHSCVIPGLKTWDTRQVSLCVALLCLWLGATPKIVIAKPAGGGPRETSISDSKIG